MDDAGGYAKLAKAAAAAEPELEVRDELFVVDDHLLLRIC